MYHFDDDCDGQIDEEVSNTYYLDSDNDGYGDPSNLILDCLAPNNYVIDNTDCNDNDDTINPSTQETCDSIDNNCDGNIDEDNTCTGWVGIKQFGSVDYDEAQDIAVDANGNVYVTGYTYGSLDGNVNSGDADLFLIKYNQGGIKEWTKQIGTAFDDIAYGISIDTSGNAYITGSTDGTLGDSNYGEYDIFVTKYNSDGTLQ
jgi:hypothetical protein